MEFNEMKNSYTFTSPQKNSSEPGTKAQSLFKDNYGSECQRWGLILLMVLGICAIAAVLLQQGCNNTSEGEEAKKIQAVARINLFTVAAASQMNSLLFWVSSARKLMTLGMTENKSEIYITRTF